MQLNPATQHVSGQGPSLLGLRADILDKVLQHTPNHDNHAVLQLNEVAFSLLWELEGEEYVMKNEGGQILIDIHGLTLRHVEIPGCVHDIGGNHNR